MKVLTAFLYVEDDLFGYVCFCIPPSVLRGREGQERLVVELHCVSLASGFG